MSLPHGPRLSRRALLAWAGASAALLWQNDSAALEPEVPVRLQVDLLNRVVPYDRNMRPRIHDAMVVLVAIDNGDVDSKRTGGQLLSELASRPTLGGFRVRTARHDFSGVPGLVEACEQQQPAIVYAAPGLRSSASSIATALSTLDVLSVATVSDQVRGGLVLGFGVRSGKPRLLVNLTQARRQHVDFRADFLRLAEVVG